VIVDIYVRQSGQETEASPEIQEAACRAYADAQGWEVEELVVESETSSQLAADERGLGYLVRRCELGESQGILCRHLDRFGRNVVEGSIAYKRINDADARLVAVADGLDSSRDGAKFQFTMMMAMGEQVYDRSRGWFLSGKARAAEKGHYGAPAPFGYDRVDDSGNVVPKGTARGREKGRGRGEGRLVPSTNAGAVRLIFKLRAEGLRFSEIAARENVPLSRSGVRKVVMNRAYLGEQRIPDPKNPGEPRTIEGCHQPIITEAEWEAANAVKTGRPPVHTGLSETVQLKGIVRCGLCGSKLTVSQGKDTVRYSCTNGCGKTSMAVHLVEPPVLHQIDVALNEHEPHVAAIIQGDTRYSDALAAVEQARADLTEYRDSPDILRELGAKAFAEGLKVRKAAIETARRALREVPRPFEQTMTREEFLQMDARRYYPRLIAEVLVFPRTSEHRLTMRWEGQDEAFPVPPIPTVNLARLLAEHKAA
jgi:DNA invertase Pin-like site-specific DNA recombinase